MQEYGPMASPALSARQRLTYAAHLYKAVARQHHRDLLPLIAPHVGAGAVVVDAGAHAGQFTKLFAGLAQGGQVHAFEPGGYALSILERVVRWRGLSNVTVVPMGLSDAEGSAELALPIKSGGSFGFGLGHLGAEVQARPTVRETVRLITLDRYAAETGLTRLDFLKADVEGWEVRLLRGAMESIARFRPAILLELVAVHLNRAGTNADEAWERLAPLGYTALRLGGDGKPTNTFAGDSDYLFHRGGQHG
jgi:FkbM family methyltransferase